MSKRGRFAPLVVTFFALLLIRVFGPIQPYFHWDVGTTRIANALLIIATAFLLSETVNRYVQNKQFEKLLHAVIWAGAIILFFFAYHDNLLAVGLSLGVIAVIAGFIFQSPLLSLVAWVYINSNNVYKRGDRIRVGDLKGEVMSISPIRTEILEVGGEYLNSDMPSGRIFKFPNSLVLQEPVCNYTNEFPYLWMNLNFHLTYETDWNFAKKGVEKILSKRLKGTLPHVKETFEKVTKEHRITAKYPGINFNLTPFQSWIEFQVIFPVNPREQATFSTHVAEDILEFFNKHPNKIKFPKGRFR